MVIPVTASSRNSMIDLQPAVGCAVPHFAV